MSTVFFFAPARSLLRKKLHVRESARARADVYLTVDVWQVLHVVDFVIHPLCDRLCVFACVFACVERMVARKFVVYTHTYSVCTHTSE